MSRNLLSKVSDRTLAVLAEGPFKSWIGGELVESAGGQKMAIIHPASGELFAEFYAMQPGDVDRAIAVAADAFRSSKWATMAPAERTSIIHKFCDLMVRDIDILSELETLETGYIKRACDNGVNTSVARFRYYADTAAKMEYATDVSVPGVISREVLKPYGVCAVINPWNGPLPSAASNSGAALATGNTIVMKPASNTPLTTLYLGRLAAEAGIPAGIFNVVAGTAKGTGQALVTDPRIKRLQLTGSVEAGKFAATACGGNLVPAKLELGGKGAALVFDDVDIDQVAAKLVGAITGFSGQICCNATRWIIHERIYDDMVAALIARMEAVRVGDPFDPATAMGSVISKDQQKRILSYIERGKAQGAHVLTGGDKAEVPGLPGGVFVQPTMLTGPLDNVAYREEIFGPVAYVTSFRDEAHGIALVNDTDYGLANSVWTKDMVRANRVAEQMVAGTSWINVHNFIIPGVRFSGIGQSGLGGGVSAASTVRDYLRTLVVTRPA